WFARAHQEFPEKPEGEQGYYWVATALQKARRYEDAARRYSEFIAAFPKSTLVEAAYRNVADSLRYAGKDNEAISWSRQIQQRYAGQPLATVGLYNEAKIELTRKNYNAAIQLFLRVSALPLTPKVVGAPIRGEAAFLRIYAIEQAGRLGEAARLYLAIPEDSDNYFGHRATLRLQAMSGAEEGKRIIEAFARGYRDQARAAVAGGRFAEAKDAATQALRLITDEAAERELLSILRTCYARLPAYNIGSRFRLIAAARPANAAVSDSSHSTLAAELLFLGLYDEGST